MDERPSGKCVDTRARARVEEGGRIVRIRFSETRGAIRVIRPPGIEIQSGNW